MKLPTEIIGDDFELRVDMAGVSYSSGKGSVSITYGEDGLLRYSFGRDAVDELYALLESRSNLRVVEDVTPYSPDPDKTDDFTTDGDVDHIVKVLRIAGWMGMSQEHRKM